MEIKIKKEERASLDKRLAFALIKTIYKKNQINEKEYKILINKLNSKFA